MRAWQGRQKPTHRNCGAIRAVGRRRAGWCEREGARVPSLRWLRRPWRAAAARGSSRPAPRTCVTGSASSPDEQTLAQSSEQRLTAALGAVAPGIGVSESGCTAVTAADTPNPGSPAPETPLAPQRSLLSGLVHPKPERSRGGAHDSASLAEALRTAARRRIPRVQSTCSSKRRVSSPYSLRPPGCCKTCRLGRAGWTVCGRSVIFRSPRSLTL